jgi:hypothetical protein
MKIIGWDWNGTCDDRLLFTDTSSRGASAYQLADLVHGKHATPSLLHN